MFYVNEDNSIYVTRGDILFFSVTAEDNGTPYTFHAGDVVRFKAHGKKDAETVYLQKDFPVTAETTTVELYFTKEDTKIGETISKPKDYWYEVELNPDTNPQTIIGYSEDGATLFRLFPEGEDIPETEIKPEDIPVVDTELDMTSNRPVENQAIARAFENLREGYEATFVAVAEINVTPQMFGAVGDGVADDTDALVSAIKTGKSVMLPAGTYKISSIADIESLVLTGVAQENVTIVVTGEIAFRNIANVRASGITFVSETSDFSILFQNDTATLAGIIEKCRFEDFKYVVYMPAYGNSLTIKNCYFRDGINGIELNYAHNCHIENNIFWQQSGNSVKLMRGSGSTISNNSIVATNGKPSVFHFLSQMCTVRNNYYENYDKSGTKNDCFVFVEYNSFSLIPKFIDNLINGDNALSVGIKFSGKGSNSNVVVVENNHIFSCDSTLEIDKNHFNSLYIKNNVGITDTYGKRYYSSAVTVGEIEDGNRVIKIDTGEVTDNFNLSVGDNTIKPHSVSGARYMLRIRGEAEATEAGSGMLLKLRTTNGVCLKEFVVSNSEIGLHSVGDLIMIDAPTESNAYYSVGYDSIAGKKLYSSLNLFVELVEL